MNGDNVLPLFRKNKPEGKCTMPTQHAESMDEHTARVNRIRESLQRINQLMAELKQQRKTEG